MPGLLTNSCYSYSIFNMLDLPACVVPVTSVDPSKDAKDTGVQYFNDTDKLIHDQCKVFIARVTRAGANSLLWANRRRRVRIRHAGDRASVSL